MENASDLKIKFRPSKKRQVRKRQSSDEEEEEEYNKEEYEKTRELQKLRKRAAGTNVITLVSGKKVSKVEELITDDPFKTKTGGLVDMKSMKGYKKEENAYEVGTQFSKETHIRDEDDELRKFIEIEMEKLKGGSEEEDQLGNVPQYLSPEDAALLSLPEHLRKSTFKKDQQMLSAQMLSGIPEVDLGIESKIQNIERTEKAKRKLIEEAKLAGLKTSKVTKDSNHTSNIYVQHDRFETEKPTTLGREKERAAPAEVTTDKSNTVDIYEEEADPNKIIKGRAHDADALNRFKEKVIK